MCNQEQAVGAASLVEPKKLLKEEDLMETEQYTDSE